MAYHQMDPEDVRRERRAERLRRSYEALGREQNGIFESLAEYTHEVQAEVRALQIARDRLYAAQQASSDPPGGEEGASSSSTPAAQPRVGRPLFVGGRWVSFEAAAVGVVICGVLGVALGVMGWGSRRQGKLTLAVVRKKDRKNSSRRLHEE